MLKLNATVWQKKLNHRENNKREESKYLGGENRQ